MCSNGRIQKFIKNNNVFGVDVMEKIASNFPQLNLYWLLLGEGEMIRKTPLDGTGYEIFFKEFRVDNEKLIRENERLKIEIDELKKKCAQIQASA